MSESQARRIRELERELLATRQTLWQIVWAQPGHRMSIPKDMLEERPATAVLGVSPSALGDTMILVARAGNEG